MIVDSLLNSKKIKNTQKIYLMTSNKKEFNNQMDFQEVISQKVLFREKLD